MTRGNQRDLARAKNQKKQSENNKGREIPEGLSLQAIKESDAEIMRQKQAAALARKNAEAEAARAAAAAKAKK